MIAKLPAIESGLGTFRGAARVYPTPDDLANRFELRVLNQDPHADAITWPGPSVTSITDPIDLGPFEDAVPATVLLLRRHALAGGATGSGKSGGLNVLMGNLTACTDVVIWAIDLKRGMELGPWASCLDRLATTPAQARALLADAVAILEARAAYLAATGQRVWEPTPDWPALIIVIDEYAELVESAPEATGDADSIARRGRAVAVTLIAATQRPTQKAMGQGALRSQMDVRICFRVRERKDVDLVLGQGMLTAGWHAHKLNAPGKFLISAPEYDTPRRARAYLLRAVSGGLTRRKVQTVVIFTVLLVSTASATLGLGLLVDSNTPFQHAFTAQRGAEVTASIDPARATTGQLAATRRLPQVTAAAGPFAEATITPRVDAIGLTMPPVTVVGRASPGGPVDELTLDAGRWARRPGEIVISPDSFYRDASAVQLIGTRITVTSAPGRPVLKVVGVAKSITGTAGAWVVPAEIAALHPPHTPAAAQMLYQFHHADTQPQLTSDVTALTRALLSGTITGTSSWLTVKTQESGSIAIIVPFVVAFGVIGLAMSVVIVATWSTARS